MNVAKHLCMFRYSKEFMQELQDQDDAANVVQHHFLTYMARKQVRAIYQTLEEGVETVRIYYKKYISSKKTENKTSKMSATAKSTQRNAPDTAEPPKTCSA